MRTKATHAARIMLGLIFFVFGLNGFLNFIPQPPMSAPPENFHGALTATGYFLPLLTTEVIAGALSGRLVPLALVVLAPDIVNIVAFHLFVAPSGLPVALAVVALEIFLVRSYWSAFANLMRVHVAPDGEDRASV
jgi:hypothetical protein